LMRREPKKSLVMPVLTSWDVLVKKFGSKSAPNDGAPEYWEDEVKKGRGESARLIKVGVDIPAIWAINDADQAITADLYINFTWNVNAKRNEIWDDKQRTFTQPIWKIRMRNGKLINNLQNSLEHSPMVDELSAGSESIEGQTTIIQRITITSNFSQKYDLRKFPFDTHEIEFIMRYFFIPYIHGTGDARRGRIIFYEDKGWNCRVKEGALKPSDEWEVIRDDEKEIYDRLTFTLGLTQPTLDPKSGRRWPKIKFSFKIKRKPHFMMWNVTVPISLTVLFGLLGNLTALDSDFDRTSFTAALLFTIFSIKNNVQYALSRVGHRSRLDNYVLLSQAMVVLQGVVGVWFSHNGTLDEDDDWEEEYQLPIIFGSIGFFCWAFITVRFWSGRHLIFFWLD